MRRSATPPLSSGMLSDSGRQRSNNQDAALSVELPHGGLYAVADGMGGHAAGEVAANVALETLINTYQNARGQAPERLAEAVQAANEAVLRRATGDLAGMGTTLIAALIDRGAALIAHVGDSRAYLLRRDTLLRLTDDHSWVAEQVRHGYLTETEARDHQWRNIVSNALGGEERIRLELFGVPLQRGDRLLLCTDGLSGVADEDDIARILSADHPPQVTAGQLVDLANARGGPDNITVLVVDVHHPRGLPHYPLPARRDEGPLSVDVFLTARRSGSPITYAALVALYFTLLGMILYPERRLGIALGGAVFLIALLITAWDTRRRGEQRTLGRAHRNTIISEEDA
ncbi:Stp1/IreP family PP2C-type Ser/Thr phosphatase [Deinococcus maricopensis]|uniref:Protein serine/threonine phosphatase n=1 Tax=Deinococcus maricopensis (strain DSM 21211 / LMG 22137 / NRRL B-23946 / LB-34) TaxID=709986 RepID=E8U4P9_DEIML|nr:Stp1/IreP family PP2C-type Ser/Thr phosphatase [Deinococcus maricopensis]ADV68914.1 protein serine/threonine phosphatase [Deinococcus maricopensis DSM 21211]